MNNTDQAFIEAYRDRREATEPCVRVMKASEVNEVVGANSPIELNFAAPSNQVVLETPPPVARSASPLPMNRKHAKHPTTRGPHYNAGEESNRSAEKSKEDMIITNSPQAAPASAEEDRAIQNAVAAGNELAVQSKIGNERLSQLLSHNLKVTPPADEPVEQALAQPQAEIKQATADESAETKPSVEAVAEPVDAITVAEETPAEAPESAAPQPAEAKTEEPAPEEPKAEISTPELSEPEEPKVEEPKPEVTAEALSAATIAGASEAVIEPAAKPELDPMWEVDSFVWPDVCNHVQQAADQVLPDLEWVFACQPNILAIGSVSRQGGATTAAICLGRHIAEAGKNVLVIDANFESPAVAEQLGVRAPCCWRDKLIEEKSLGEASITSIEDRMTLMPLYAGDPPPEKFAAAIQQAINANASGYDLAIIDIGVIDHARDANLWSASGVFGGLLVVRDMRHDGEAALASAIDAAEQCGSENVAVIENFTE